ncbi:MAG: site-specific integrase [Rhodoblastus sp.]
MDRGEWSQAERAAETQQTLGDTLARYGKEVTPLKRASESESHHLKQITRHPISKLQLARLSSADVATFRDDRLKTVAGSTVRKELGLLANVLKTARNEWGLTASAEAVRAVRKPPAARGRDRRLLPGELEALLKAFGQCRNKTVRRVFLFALATGMRRGEVLSLVWSDVDLVSATAHLPLTKNGEARTVPLGPEAIAVLREVIRQWPKQTSPSGQVFPLSANSLKLAWQRVKCRADIVGLRFHDLRHEAISRFFELGLTVPEVSLISGHKDTRMLFRYTHLRPEAVAEKLKALTAR